MTTEDYFRAALERIACAEIRVQFRVQYPAHAPLMSFRAPEAQQAGFLRGIARQALAARPPRTRPTTEGVEPEASR